MGILVVALTAVVFVVNIILSVITPFLVDLECFETKTEVVKAESQK